ncbi:MAG: VanW family protein [Candidatus Moranbacteria bacterium]|nr:VanW family protein [Candidatus Moranbacteria bacterium]
MQNTNFFKICLFSLLLILSLGAVKNVQAFKEENKLGLFNNKPLQEILVKPFYLFGSNEENLIPFYLKDFIDWDHQITYDPSYSSEIENPFFVYQKGLLENAYLELSQPFKDKLRYRKSSTVYIKEDETKTFLDSISKDINQEPTNGKFRINENGQITILKKSHKGSQLLVEKSYQKLKKNLLENPETFYIPLTVIESLPEISTENPEKYQIKELVGTGKSDFTGSTDTRIHNIKTAATRFDGIMIKPEEELSFIKILGEVDESTGYKEELVIKKNQTVPEFGGGICQISTTLFRSALNTGLKITERHNHSFPVHYYNPPGTDATVYIPKPDLKIKNTTEDYLLIQTRIDESKKKFYIDFYSREDLFDVELIGPEVVERTPGGKLRTTLKQIVKDQQGREISQDIFKSFYDNPDNYPSPDQIVLEKPKDWSNRQWNEYYEKFGAIIEELKKKR